MRETELEINLWGKVIKSAITDIVYYDTTKILKNRKLKRKHKEWKISALNFLFNDDFFFPFDTYSIQFNCEFCHTSNSCKITEYVNSLHVCSSCSKLLNNEETSFQIIEVKKEINLRELLSVMGLENIEYLRKSFKKEIRDRIKERIEL